MFEKLRKYYKKQLFQPTIWGIFFNPFYITRKALFRGVKKMTKYIKGKTLDVGCGQKPYQNLFEKCTSYVGMDIEVSGHSHQNESIDVFYDGKTIPFNDQEFDSVVCNQVLEHVPNPSEILMEIRRVLKTDGFLLLSVPFINEEHEQPFDYFRYTSFGIEQLLEECQMEVVEYKKLNKNIILVCTSLWICYLYKLTKTKHPWVSLLLTPFLFTQSIIIGKLLSFILPSSEDFFMDSILIARKR